MSDNKVAMLATVLNYNAIQSKIKHILTIYPIISPAMLQVGIGNHISPSVWRPVLIQLIADKAVLECEEYLETPSGRKNTYTKLSLNSTKK